MLKLKLQYSGHLMWRANWLKKTLMLGKVEGRRRRGWQRMRRLAGIPTQWTSLSKLQRRWRTGKPGMLQSTGSQRVHGVTTERLNSNKTVFLSFLQPPLWPHCAACRISVPWPEIEPRPLAGKLLSPDHWTARKFLLKLLFFKKSFYWSVVALWYVSFCCRAQWISYTYTQCPLFMNFFPIQVTTEHSAEFPLLCSRFSLVICFIHSIDNAYLSIPVHPTPSPALVPTNLFSMSTSLFLLCK